MHRSLKAAALFLATGSAPLLAQEAPQPAQPPQPTAPGRITTTRVVRPTGWIGISYSASSTNTLRATDTVTYSTYPVIEAVVPGSPADKAGLQVGDTLLSFNGRDFRDAGVPFKTILRPGERIVVRLRRDRRERRVTVTVGERPGGYAYSFTPVPGANRMQLDLDQLTRQSEQLRAQLERIPWAQHAAEVRAAYEAAIEMERGFLMNPPSTPSSMFAWPSGAMAIMAGAEVVRMNEDLGSVLGVNRGILIVNVAPGTAADNAGLKGGDVIVSSESGEITTPADFQRAITRATRRKSLRLNIVRRGRPQSITIRL